MRTTNERLVEIIRDGLVTFYDRRIDRLNSLKLRDMLKRKNPYLYKAKGMQSAPEIVSEILSAFTIASDETIFGEVFFEPIVKEVSGGVISPSEGVDVAVETADRYLAIAVKSGPNPFNSSQKKRQNDEFMELRSRLKKLKKQFDALLAHCYGRKHAEPSKTVIYRVRAGQEFWREITGDPDFYIKLVDLMSERQILHQRDLYREAYDRAINRYVREFTVDFCDTSGSIDWAMLVEFNSGSYKGKWQARP